MGKEFLLVNPPGALDIMFGAGLEFIQPLEPLGLLYIAAVMIESGYGGKVIDAPVEGIFLEVLKKTIADEVPFVLGISVLTSQGSQAYELGKWVKTNVPGVLVVLGNIHASVFAETYLKNGCCDVVVHGEGEEVFLEVVRAAESGSGFSNIPAVSYIAADKTVRRNPGIAVVKDITTLPPPARHLLKKNEYRLGKISNRSFISRKNDRVRTLITSRGCPNRCIFCNANAGITPRINSAVRIADEMELLVKEYGVTYIMIEDSLFLTDRKNVLALCDEIVRRGIKVLWGCEAHINYISDEVVKAIYEAGCYEVSIGIETASQRLLDYLRKDIRLEDVAPRINSIKKNTDIRINGLFMFGIPGETPEDTRNTIDLACSLPLDMAQFSILTPYPGTRLFEKLSAEGGIDTGCRADGEIDISVWNRYSPHICFSDMEPVWAAEGFTADSLRKIQKRALRAFYLRPKQIMRQLGRLRPNNFIRLTEIVLKGLF